MPSEDSQADPSPAQADSPPPGTPLAWWDWPLPEDGLAQAEPSAALWAAVERGQAGLAYKRNLERLLQDLLPERADEHLMLRQEGRGAFLLLLEGPPGHALFVGDALSGTVSALAGLGFRVTVCDPHPARLAFAKVRDAALAPGQVTHRPMDAGAAPADLDGSFDLVVAELGPRGEAPVWGSDWSGLLSLTRGTLAAVVDNSLAYKRALGQRGRFEYVRPWTFLARALRPQAGEGTRRGFRRRFTRPGWTTQSLALYPHRLECSHVVQLDRPGPGLTVGRLERRNHLKVWAHRLGAFPWLAPSFVWVSQRGSQPGQPAPHRLQRWLDGVAQELDAPAQRPEHLIATRGNVAVVLTHGPKKSPGWALHVPLCAQKHRLLRRHADCLQLLAREFPDVPAPKLLWQGDRDGAWFTVEERLEGQSAPQLDASGPAQAHMFGQMAERLTLLKRGPDQVLDDARLEALLGDRVRRVVELCGRRGTAKHIITMLREFCEAVIGMRVPTVLYHADLRPKHVQVDDRGHVLGVMDWGAYEEEFLPYMDLLHLFAHLRADSARWSWLRLMRGELEPWERAGLDAYARRLELPAPYLRAMERFYPVLVAGMAERNWDFSRPYWVHREFGL